LIIKNLLDLNAKVLRLKFNHDKLLSCGMNGKLLLFSILNEKIIASFNSNHSGPIYACEFLSPFQIASGIKYILHKVEQMRN
jgi:hypothetical protein